MKDSTLIPHVKSCLTSLDPWLTQTKYLIFNLIEVIYFKRFFFFINIKKVSTDPQFLWNSKIKT